MKNSSLGKLMVESNLTTLRHTPRKSVTFTYDLSRSLTDSDTTTIHASQEYGEKRYYPVSDDFNVTARQRTEQRRFDFDLRRKLPAAFYFRAQAIYRLSRYNYDYDEAVDELIQQRNNLRSLFEYRFNLSRWCGRQLHLSCEYLFNRSKEDFGTRQINQKSETGRLKASATLAILDADTIQVSGQMGVTSYFSPSSSEFFSDRDRTVEVASFRLTHRFTRFLRGAVDGSFRGFHTIYLSGSLSANNNVNNIYILNPSLLWRPCRSVAVEQNYQLHANYIYYDFEKSSLVGRNTIYRRANFTNKIILFASRKTDFTLEYGYRYEDFGPIRYTDQWQQQISWDRRTHRPKFGLDFHPSTCCRFQPYIVYEIQQSYDHLFDPDNTLGRREQSEEFVRKLVGFDLQLTLSPTSYIDCKLERRVQEYQNQRNQEYDLFTITMRKSL